MKKRGLGFFRFFDITRRIILNLIFWGIIAGVIIYYVAGNRVPAVSPGSILVVRPTGYIVEYSTSSKIDLFADENEIKDTTLRELTTTLSYAAEDNNIVSVILDLRSFSGSGLSKLQEIAECIKKVKDAGKTVVAYANTFTQGRYFLACHADNIVLDPLGEIMFTGMGDYRNYFGRGFEKFGIKMNVFRAGDYKSAVEPYTSDKMSPAAKEASSAYLGALWGQYLDTISKERNLSKKEIDSYISGYASVLEKYKGNSAEAAKAAKFIDKIGVYEDASTLAGIGAELNWKDYYKNIENEKRKLKENIAVVIASGTIISGTHSPGTIGSDSYVSILKSIKDDASISAVVLRIDSGGGGVGASESIRRELQKVRERGKPVIVSMSSTAASGAYWISTASDQIFSMPGTLTGSIGVFSVLPDITDFLARYPGITTDGYGTTKYSSFYRPDIPLTDDMKKVMNLGIQQSYSQFLNLVSNARDISLADTRKLAGGRVWSGTDAKKLKLTDGYATLEQAIEAAAEQSGVTDYSVQYFEPGENWRTSISKTLGNALGVNNKFINLDYSGNQQAELSSVSLIDNYLTNLIEENQAVYDGPEYIFR